MITLNDIRIMNEALIIYYKKNSNEKKILKHQVIKEILKYEDCFYKMSKNDAIRILEDVNISKENVESVYQGIMN